MISIKANDNVPDILPRVHPLLSKALTSHSLYILANLELTYLYLNCRYRVG